MFLFDLQGIDLRLRLTKVLLGKQGARQEEVTVAPIYPVNSVAS